MIPQLAEWGWETSGKRVLEVGCSEAGILQGFADAGASVTGAEISQKRVNAALSLQQTPFPVLLNDICDLSSLHELKGPFDLILLRDVIEHLFDRDAALTNLATLLSENGRVMITFPPWYMPFGGHQQALKNSLRKIPWLHLLPLSIYKRLMRLGTKGDKNLYQDLMNTRSTGLTLSNYRKLLERTGYVIDREVLWMVNPAYTIKFGMKARPAGIIGKIPFVREFMVTSMYSLLKRG